MVGLSTRLPIAQIVLQAARATRHEGARHREGIGSCVVHVRIRSKLRPNSSSEADT